MKTKSYQIEERSIFETVALRVLFSLVTIWTLPSVAQMSEFTAQPKPVGLGHIIDLSFLAKPITYQALCILVIVALLFYSAGIQIQVALGVACIAHIGVFTLYNSQGVAYHSQNIVSLVLLAQWIVYLWPATRRIGGNSNPAKASDASIHYATVVVVGVYVVSGLTKLIVSKGLWIYQSPWIAVELLKTNAQNYYNWLEVDATYSHRMEVAQWIVSHPNFSRLFLGAGLLIELLAFVGLRDRLWSLIVGLCLIALHLGIDLTMGLFFQYNVAAIVIFLVNPVYWLEWKSRNELKISDSKLGRRNRSPDYPWR